MLLRFNRIDWAQAHTANRINHRRWRRLLVVHFLTLSRLTVAVAASNQSLDVNCSNNRFCPLRYRQNRSSTVLELDQTSFCTRSSKNNKPLLYTRCWLGRRSFRRSYRTLGLSLAFWSCWSPPNYFEFPRLPALIGACHVPLINDLACTALKARSLQCTPGTKAYLSDPLYTQWNGIR